MNLRPFIDRAGSPTPWDCGNRVLYELCETEPLHNDHSVVVAKLWLIGRAYAVAIERRKNATESNERFYVEKVAPAIIESDLDAWIKEAAVAPSWTTLLNVHEKTMQLFRKISGLEKRSLASKYLHFHVPKHFYIYDSRARHAISRLKGATGRAPKGEGTGDNEYRRFAEKCRALHDHIEKEYEVNLTPRELDNLLLEIAKKPNITIESDT